MSLHSAACCTVPPVVSKGYEPKGKYVEVDGLKTYRTGDAGAKHAIFVIYDVFGYFPQTIQGADILAYGDKEKQYQVFMPDFFQGSPADITWFPPDTAEKGQKLSEFFSTIGAPPKTAKRVPELVAAIKKDYTGLESFAVVGYCWGGKVVNLTCREGTLFRAAAVAHPAMVDPDDALKVAVPIAVLPSQDEDKEAVTAYAKGLKVDHVVEWFPTQIHGWMAARSNLEDAQVKKEYQRGYKLLLDFFHKHM